jgi:hypothetical protein
MRKFQFKTGLVFASWAMLLVFGCHKKRPDLPSQQPPPTIGASQPPVQQVPPPTTQEGQQPQQNPPAGQESQQASSNKPSPGTPAKTTPKHPRQHATNKKPPEKSTTEMARNVPPKIVIQEGGTNSSGTSQVSPGSANGAALQSQSTEQLLDGTEAILRNLKRLLSTDEQSMVTQIRDYMTQSKQATKDGDATRAHNLALKAHLLSDELAKVR